MSRREKPASRGSVDRSIADQLRIQRERLARLGTAWRPLWGPLTLLRWSILSLAVVSHDEDQRLRIVDYVDACAPHGSRNRVRANVQDLASRGALCLVTLQENRREKQVVATQRLVVFFNTQIPRFIDD